MSALRSTPMRFALPICMFAVLHVLAGCGGTEPTDGAATSGAEVSDVSTGSDGTVDSTPQDTAEPAGCTPNKCAQSEGSAGLCQVWTCDAADKCVAATAADGAACDDETDCTTKSTCMAGACEGKNIACPCMPSTEASCWKAMGLNPDNLCTGVPECVPDPSRGQNRYACKLKVGSAVTCDSTNDKDCMESLCNAQTGACGLGPAKDGSPCEDGIACTKVDSCVAGKCHASEPANLCFCTPTKGIKACWGKLNLLESDKCGPKVFCEETTDSITQLTNYACRTKPNSAVVCDPKQSTQCQSHVCDSTSGSCVVKAKPDLKTLCDDGNSCTANTTCKGGHCGGGITVCKCQKDADCASQEDGDACNGTLSCDLSTKKCVVDAATIVQCPNTGGAPCLRDFCEKSTGKCLTGPAEQFKMITISKYEFVPGGQVTLIKLSESYNFLAKKVTNVFCSDGNSCTKSDQCVAGECVAGPSVGCPACTIDADCAKYGDNNACTGTMGCLAGKCQIQKGSVPAACSGPVPGTCLIDACQPKGGTCAKVSFGAACDDKNDCTVDSCGADTKTCAHAPAKSGVACYLWGFGAGKCDATGGCIVP